MFSHKLSFFIDVKEKKTVNTMKNICTCKVVVFSLGFFSLIVIKCFVFIHKFIFFPFIFFIKSLVSTWKSCEFLKMSSLILLLHPIVPESFFICCLVLRNSTLSWDFIGCNKSTKCSQWCLKNLLFFGFFNQTWVNEKNGYSLLSAG